MKRLITVLVSMLTAGLLVACGGGGGGGDGVDNIPAAGVSITQDNAEAVGAAVLNSVDNVEGATGGVDILTGVSIAVPASDFNYADFFIRQLDRLAELGSQSNNGSVTGVVIPPTTESCDSIGSSVTISGDVSDENSLSVGDTITITFNNCDEFGIVLNGTMTLTISQLTANFDGTPPFTLGVDVVLDAFSVDDGGIVVTANGDMSMLLSEDLAGNANAVLSGNSLTASAAGVVETMTNYMYDITGNDMSGDYSLDLSGTINSMLIGGAVSFESTETFSGNDFGITDNPTSGVLWITTSIDNSQALLIAQPDGTNVEIKVDADGDDIYETSIMTTWAKLDSL